MLNAKAMQKYVRTTTGIGTSRTLERYGDCSADPLADDFSSLLFDFEQKFSSFREDSLLSQLNRHRSLHSDDADFRAMLEKGLRAEQLSNGYFSLRVGWALTSLGYGRPQMSSPHVATLERKEKKLMLDKSRSCIQLVGEGEIDLWGLGKGYLISLFEKIFRAQGIDHYYINGGGDIAVQQSDFSFFWPLLLQNPLHLQQIVAKVPLLRGACCTSGTSYRKRVHNAQHVHHLINPQTSQPVKTSLVGVSVVAEEVLVADIVATILFVAPIEQVEEIAKRFDVEYLLIFDDLSSIRSRGFELV